MARYTARHMDTNKCRRSFGGKFASTAVAFVVVAGLSPVTALANGEPNLDQSAIEAATVESVSAELPAPDASNDVAMDEPSDEQVEAVETAESEGVASASASEPVTPASAASTAAASGATVASDEGGETSLQEPAGVSVDTSNAEAVGGEEPVAATTPSADVSAESTTAAALTTASATPVDSAPVQPDQEPDEGLSAQSATVDRVTISLKSRPSAGANSKAAPPDVTITATGATLESAYWSKSVGYSTGDDFTNFTFEAGKEYYVRLAIKANDGYEFQRVGEEKSTIDGIGYWYGGVSVRSDDDITKFYEELGHNGFIVPGSSGKEELLIYWLKATATKSVWIDNTVDRSVSYVIGRLAITDPSTGKTETREIYNKSFETTYSNPKPNAVQEGIAAAEQAMRDYAEQHGLTITSSASTSESTGEVWDYRKYETVEDGDAILIGDTSYMSGALGSSQGTSTHIASGDYGKNVYYTLSMTAQGSLSSSEESEQKESSGGSTDSGTTSNGDASSGGSTASTLAASETTSASAAAVTTASETIADSTVHAASIDVARPGSLPRTGDRDASGVLPFAGLGAALLALGSLLKGRKGAPGHND